ncbi:MAG: AAA domain-containing protein [Gammaproteobacteria bacterium]|nr:AAA domain-containing protein [Gammaproteobacteria bacterium]
MAWRIEVLRQNLPDEIDDLVLVVDTEVKFENFNALKNQLNDLGDEWSAIPEEARYAWAGYLPNKYKEKYSQKFINTNQNVIETLTVIDEYLHNHNGQESVPLLFEAGRCLALSKTSPHEVLKELPIGVNTRVIHNVVSNEALSEYQGLLNDINAYLSNVTNVNQTFDFSHDDSNKYAALLHLHSKALANIALNSSVSINQIQEEKKNFLNAVTHLESLADNSKYVLDILNRVARTLEDYNTISTVADDLVKGPIELSLHANIQHVKTSITNYLSKAKEKYSELEKRTVELGIFNVNRIQSSEEVDDVLKTIESNIGSFFAIFNGDYRRAKKKVKSILNDAGNFEKSEIFIDKLRNLYNLSKDIESFSISVDYKVALGELFMGMNTDWGKLESLVSFSQKLREKVGIENARNILSDWDSHVDTTTELKDKLARSIQEINKFKRTHPFPDSMWSRPVVEIANTIKPWLEKISKADEDLNHAWCRSTTTLAEAKEVVSLFRKAVEQGNDIERLEAFSTLLDGKWEKSRTDYSKLEQINQWLTDKLSIPGMHISILSWLISEDGVIDKDRYVNLHSNMLSFSKAWNSGIQTFSQYGELEEATWLGGKSQTIRGLTEKLQVANKTITSLPLMMRWAHTSKSVDDKGFGIISDYISSDILKDEQCGKAYEYILYKTIYTERIQSNELLADFSATRYQNIRDRFAVLDREIMDVNAEQIAAKLVNADVPIGNGSGRVGTHTQKRLLVNEANKKTRHIPIRQLVRRSGEALQALKPCFLMSPLSVAQYLSPGDINFDLVVMDEASQMRPEDALGAIARSDKSIIVGDPKQLPPTSFFDSSASASDDEEEETVLDYTEAILDVCLKQFPYRRLRWHYRSEHESLIQFSNEKFYDGDLIVFPSPKRESREYGVHYNYIDTPSYKRGRNRKEAEIVVENIIHHFHRHSKKSLGVAAFNKAQAEEITILLDRARQKDPAIDKLISEQDQSAPLFIKNLENVQGDERDVIFISTTYGPEEPGGPVAQRFGPINSDLGWRRLNVIATRAKQRVELFTSMRPTDIRIGENSKKGARALRDYLDYALTGKVLEKGIATGNTPDSEFEVAVIKLINQLGFECEPQVGVAGFYIDIGVVNPDRPGEYLLGIECDGATYHSSVSVRDRDRLRQEILESKGWFIHRIWSTNWFHTRSTEIDRLKRVIEGKIVEDRRSYTAIADYEETPEVINEAAFATEEEIDQENEEEGILLEEALERFWLQNIQPLYPDRSKSILSEKMIEVLVNKRPTNKDDWFSMIPTELRQTVHPDEGEFRQDIFEIIEEYEII